jgi:flavin reductase (DIM6/NTAB) family NADH-FMN oxidoreductase RutF
MSHEPQAPRASEASARDAFRHAMRRFATTVSIISCAHEGRRYGMTATAVTSVCIEPPTLLICANNATSTHGALSRSGRFCVNILRSFQAELSKAFSGTVKGDERFRLGDWRLAPDGLPFLADAQANLFCTVDQAVHYHSHTIFVARVDAITAGKEVDPLVYQDGAYAVARPVLESGAPRA